MARRIIDGKRIVLTGVSSGLGKAIANCLAPFRPKIILSARRQSELETVADLLNQKQIPCDFVAGDLTDSSVRKSVVALCNQKFDGIDMLINNAGIGAMGPFAEANPQRLRQVFELNFFSMVELTRTALPSLTTGNDPVIVNIGSVLGHRAVPLKSEYCASKFAVHGFSDALRAELVPAGIEVLHVCPATIDTGFFDAAVEDTTGKNWKSRSAMKPDYVANQIIRAIQCRKQELILPWSAKLFTWLDRLAPTLANRLIARFGQ